jgi:hypothetical protein
MFDFKILFAIIFIIISDENVNQVFSQIHVRVAYLFLVFILETKMPVFKKILSHLKNLMEFKKVRACC